MGKILLFRGRGLISALIRWQTRSIYSHAAILLDDKETIIEAWQGKGVRKKFILDWSNVDHFDVRGWDENDWRGVFRYLESKIGYKYDYKAIFRFISRRKMPANKKFFCSELVLSAALSIGKPLLNGNPSELSPRDLSLSTDLVNKNFQFLD